MINDFGPQRKADNKHPDVPFANAFIGNYLRMLVLMDEGCYERALREIGDYFGYMAGKPLRFGNSTIRARAAAMDSPHASRCGSCS